jgi:uncharacterized protein involved in exopolysaccharide biosynthesis
VIAASSCALARSLISAYLDGRTRQSQRLPRDGAYRDGRMVQPASAPESTASARLSGVAAAIVAAAAVFSLVAVVGAVALWVHYGTAVFFEMIKSGIAACI